MTKTTFHLYVVSDDKVNGKTKTTHKRWSYASDTVISNWNPCLFYLGRRHKILPPDWKYVTYNDVVYVEKVLVRLGTPHFENDQAAARDTEEVLAMIKDALATDCGVFIRQY